MLITDTVGFIRKLPHHLIHAFRSTLDEAVYCDFLIIVVDASDEECLSHMAVTEGILENLNVSDKPRLYVFNKSDLCTPERLYDLRLFKSSSARVVAISAKNGEGLEELQEQLEQMCRAGKSAELFLFPYTEQGALNSLYKLAEIRNTKYIDEGVLVEAVVDAKTKGMFQKFLKN
jgi:GTP-binding protein HflX